MVNNKMFWILVGFILIMQIPIFLMAHFNTLMQLRQISQCL